MQPQKKFCTKTYRVDCRLGGSAGNSRSCCVGATSEARAADYPAMTSSSGAIASGWLKLALLILGVTG
jgi:hypothetical protein